MNQPADRPIWSRPLDPDRAYVTNPHAIRALAHPSRLAMLRRLQADGPATATECARIAGVTPSAASYHLRQLARYGFVGPAPGRGDRRERIWQSLILGYRIDEVEAGGPAMLEAQLELLRATAKSADELLQRWLERMPNESVEWRAASMIGTKTVRVNADELGAVFERIAELLQPYLANRRGKSASPPDARLVHIDLRMFPWEDIPTLRLAPEPFETGE